MEHRDRSFMMGAVPLHLTMDPSSKVSGPATVLFVDDDLSFLGMLQRTFAGHGDHQLLWFNNPSEALERFAQDPNSVKLVVTDYNMPRLSGNELARCLRKLNPAIRIIGISSDIDQFDLELFDLTMVKTHKKQSLIEAMERVLAR